MRNSTIDIRPLSLNTGAEIRGIDLAAPLPELTYQEIRAALNQWGVIFFRDQELTPAQHVAFARRFGNIHSSPYMTHLSGHPFIYEVRKEPGETRNVGGNWHTDHPFQEVPPLGSILLAQELPPSGGDTMFASMYAAYEALSDGLKKTLSGMRAVHAKVQSYKADTRAERQVSPEKMTKLEADLAQAVAVHPVTPLHPESGRRVLYVSPTYTVRFEGWTQEESRPLLDYLFRHATAPENTCRFHWEEHSLAFWDNRSTLHYALNDYHGARRLMHRITVDGNGWG